MAERGSARHTKQSFSDQETVGNLCAWIARTRRAMPDLKVNDKWPNIDGYIIMTDDKGYSLGTLKAQVKKLSKTDAKYKRFHFTENDGSREKFIKYCEESPELPIILIGVDIHDDHQLAYWRHIDKHYLKSLGVDEEIEFPPENIISRTDARFVEEWQSIAEAQNKKASIAEAYTARELERITYTGTRILGKEDDNFRAIHLFLDILNSLLDRKFSIIKEIFYLNCWKVGFAYFNYSAYSVGYILYPIPFAKNDVLIKEVDENLFKDFEQLKLGYSIHHSNPIVTDPSSEVKKILRHKLDILIQERLFVHTGSEALAREYVFAFVERYHEQMGLPPCRDGYSLKEVDEGFHVYLPLWLDEAFHFMKTNNRNNFSDRLSTGRIQYYDLDWGQEISDALDAISTKVQERMKNGDRVPAMPAGARILSPRIFAELLGYLEGNGVQQVRRLYSPWNRQAGASWQTLTPDQVAANLELFLEGFLNAYATFIEKNFPVLKEKLSFLGAADKLLCVYDLQTNQPIPGPGYTMCFLKSHSNSSGKIIEVLSRQEFGQDDGGRRTISVAGHEYTNKGIHREPFPRIHSGAPILDLVYKMLTEKLKQIAIEL